ncbi:nucleotide exchange factor GrpE [Faunimonas sp. B44]|uniref:nucleotide exchange factor GrpE n=1 Tax=Faunimonas sp. B44 TaxID=3461493 RepID=UPI004043A6DC
MNDTDQTTTESRNPAAASETGADAEMQASGAETGISAETVARLEGEKADLTDRLVRVAADLDNFRKRSEREIGDARKYAVTKFAADMLTVADNLARALENVTEEAKAEPAVASLVEGVEMTAREMERLLGRHGVEVIAAMGERFDPHRHQAVFEVPDASVPAGTVVQVMQPGYMIGDRVLRAAMVGVSKGGPKATAPATETETAEGR